MKKVLLSLTILLALSVGTVFAAPISTLTKDQTAVGILLHHNNNSYYVENKVTDTLTVGYEQIYLNTVKMNNFYAQFNAGETSRFMLGFKDLRNSSRPYAGYGVTTALSPEWSAYATILGGDQFTEVQVGATYAINENYDFNLNYRGFDDTTYTGLTTVGVIYKF